MLRILALPLLCIVSAFAVPLDSSTSPQVTLPTVTALALDRQKVTLPADFAQPMNLLILSFARDQENVVDSWIPLAAKDPQHPVETWLLPVSQRENGVYRWWLNASLRGSQAASQPRHNTVPLYVDKPEFLRALQIPSERDVVVLLTDKSGHVMWRSSGSIDDGKKAAFSSFLRSAGR